MQLSKQRPKLLAFTESNDTFLANKFGNALQVRLVNAEVFLLLMHDMAVIH